MTDELLKYVSPPGEAAWIAVDKPSKRFKREGEYAARIVIAEADLPAVHAVLSPLLDAAVARFVGKTVQGKFLPPEQALRKQYEVVSPLVEEMDRVTGTKTGRWVLGAKNGVFIPGTSARRTIPVFDAGNPPKRLLDTQIGRGSILRLSGELVPYCSDAMKRLGIAFRLNAVQIMKYEPIGVFSGSMSPEMNNENDF